MECNYVSILFKGAADPDPQHNFRGVILGKNTLSDGFRGVILWFSRSYPMVLEVLSYEQISYLMVYRCYPMV